ncbi:hypothetical protein HanOQP8_Chr03g0090041 [Helianthus annuus]|nr:hypothetical protein HanOQP8_Chr03g0090041 [Helianthus annuus]
MGVFSAKRGNLLEEIYVASGSRGVKSGKAPHKIDISMITPPASPPSRTFDLPPPPPGDDLGEKKKQDDVEVEHVGEGGAAGGAGDAGGAGGDGRGKGVETEAESSKATPRQTIYTRRPPGSRGGATSGVPRSPEYEHVQAGSSDTHNPACADLPHAPRWNLTQGSRMTELANCRERNWFDLLDDHIHAGVNFFATSQEIVREWQLIGEDTLEFENAKKSFAEEKEKFNAEKKGLLWRVTDAEEKLAKEKQVNIDKQKDWEFACERTNKELQAHREAIVRLSGEKTKISDEAEEERAAHRKREQEYVARIAKLEKFAEEKIAESKASEVLVEEVTTDCKWLLARAVPLISQRIAGSEELARYMYDLGEAACALGRKEGYAEGRAAAEAKEPLKNFELYKTDCAARYAEKRQEFESLEFGVVKAAEKLSRKPNGVALLKKALGDEDHETRGAGTSHPD